MLIPTVCFYAATTTIFRDVITMSICSAVTVAALPDGEENPTELAVFHTDFHFGQSSGKLGILVAELLRIRVPLKIATSPPVKMVCTRPSTAGILAIIRWRHAGEEMQQEWQHNSS